MPQCAPIQHKKFKKEKNMWMTEARSLSLTPP
jgi:hypothetical protein